MAMPGRTYAAPGSLDDKYRYSHNGQEKDNEIFIGALSAEYWEYDSRTGRRWERDPIVKEWESPYACFANNPIWYSDVKGLDAKNKGDKKEGSDKGKDKKKSKDKSKDKAKEKGKDNAKDKGNPEVIDPEFPLNHEGNDTQADEVVITAERTPTTKPNEPSGNNGSGNASSNKIILHENVGKEKEYVNAARNFKAPARKNTFYVFCHADNRWFLHFGHVGLNAQAFDEILKKNSGGYREARNKKELITLVLIGCNMAAKDFYANGKKHHADITIAENISKLGNGTIVIAADGYIINEVVNGSRKVVGVANYKLDGGFITYLNGKQVVPKFFMPYLKDGAIKEWGKPGIPYFKP